MDPVNGFSAASQVALSLKLFAFGGKKSYSEPDMKTIHNFHFLTSFTQKISPKLITLTFQCIEIIKQLRPPLHRELKNPS